MDAACVFHQDGSLALDAISSPSAKLAAKEFSATACSRFNQQLLASAEYCAKMISQDTIHVYRMDKAELFRVVSRTHDGVWRCSCLEDATWLIPNRHVLAALRVVNNGAMIDAKYFGDRWRIQRHAPESLTRIADSCMGTRSTISLFFRDIHSTEKPTRLAPDGNLNSDEPADVDYFSDADPRDDDGITSISMTPKESTLQVTSSQPAGIGRRALQLDIMSL